MDCSLRRVRSCPLCSTSVDLPPPEKRGSCQSWCETHLTSPVATCRRRQCSSIVSKTGDPDDRFRRYIVTVRNLQYDVRRQAHHPYGSADFVRQAIPSSDIGHTQRGWARSYQPIENRAGEVAYASLCPEATDGPLQPRIVPRRMMSRQRTPIRLGTACGHWPATGRKKGTKTKTGA
jgi:hypothetical protein